MQHRLIIIDDDQDISLLLKTFFEKNGFNVGTFNNGKSAVSWLKKNQVDVILCDFKLPDYTGIEILQKIKILQPNAQVIIITGYSDVKIAVEAMRKGAFEYVTKPLYPDEILMTVNEAIEIGNEVRNEKPTEVGKPKREKRFITGNSYSAQLTQKHIALIAPTDMSVIIQGETGTGKEYVARAIHKQSKRKNRPFVAIDCGALPKELAGSELFGHVRGAFTGAIADKKGCFELADKGTLFLDEIGNLSYDNQVKLLRVLQEHVIKRIGGVKDIEVNVRVIVASNETLIDEVKSGEFREDIYHRLNEFKIDLAPLRERREDIPVYLIHFLDLANTELGKQVKGFTKEARQRLIDYYWHGNLRELRNVVKRSVLLCQGKQIESIHLPTEIVTFKETNQFSLDKSLVGSFPGSLKEVVWQAERMAIIKTLKLTHNNKSRTAEILDIDRKTLYNKLKTYNIHN